MSTVEDIERTVRQLSVEELATFRAWFAEFDADLWDRQFQEDVAAGRLDRLADEALRIFAKGAAPTCEPSRHSWVLVLLSTVAGQCSAVSGQVLRSLASLHLKKVGRSGPSASACTPEAPSRHESGRVLDRTHANYDRLLRG